MSAVARLRALASARTPAAIARLALPPAAPCGRVLSAACAAAAELGGAAPDKALLYALTDAWLRVPLGSPGTAAPHACTVLRSASVAQLAGETPLLVARRVAAVAHDAALTPSLAATALWDVAFLGLGEAKGVVPPLADAVAAAAATRPFSGADAANALLAAAKLGCVGDAQLLALGRAAARLAGEGALGGFQATSNCLWAVAKLGMGVEGVGAPVVRPLLAAAAAAARGEEGARGDAPQAAANALWAAAALGLPRDADDVAALAAAAAAAAPRFSAAEAANAGWAAEALALQGAHGEAILAARAARG